jgi:hypothetical protein
VATVKATEETVHVDLDVVSHRRVAIYAVLHKMKMGEALAALILRGLKAEHPDWED